MIAIHRRTLYVTGEAYQSIRDHGRLESAVMRPRFLAHDRGADLCEQAAVLGLGISRSQPFVEGNKRTGQMAVIFFLDLDGRRLVADPLDPRCAQPGRDHDQVERDLAVWLRSNVAPIA